MGFAGVGAGAIWAAFSCSWALAATISSHVAGCIPPIWPGRLDDRDPDHRGDPADQPGLEGAFPAPDRPLAHRSPRRLLGCKLRPRLAWSSEPAFRASAQGLAIET